jgi:hypothetical protein
MDTLIKTLEGIEGRKGKVYWINALVSLKEINEAKAGYLLYYFNLL